MTQNIPQFSVSEFSKVIKNTIENAFGYVKITGEITGFKKASSGHLYFNLKEDNALLTAVCFRNQAKNINFEIGDGLEICAYGQITVYEGRSNYQIIIDKIEIAGIGAILEMIEKRRQKLMAEGLFDEKYKKPLPFFPKIIGVITSETGAVIEDIKHRIADRCPLHLLLYPSAVQGERAPNEIIAGLRYFNNLKINRPEVIIIARGGGSFEDLQPFNDENLVREVFKSDIPVISAVGHETDFTLIDFVADVRAPTPTASAEFVTPVLVELKNQLHNLQRQISNAIENYFNQKIVNLKNIEKNIIHPQKYLENIEHKFKNFSEKISYLVENNLQNKILKMHKINIDRDLIAQKITNYQQNISYNFAIICKNIQHNFSQKNTWLEGLSKAIKSSNYHQMLERGFAVIKDSQGKLITKISDLQKQQNFVVIMSDGEANAITTQSSNNICHQHLRSSKAQPQNSKSSSSNQANLFDFN